MVFILSLDVLIELDILHGLVLDILVKGLLDGALELVIVVDVLNHVEHRIFESLNVGVIGSYLVLVFANNLLHHSPALAQVINHKAEIGVCAVVLLEGSVHLVGLFLQLADLLLLGLDLPLEFLNLVI